jgi:hypothetical protein
MRRFGAALLILLLAAMLLLAAGPAAAQPAPRSFGPDTYRTGVFTGEGTTRPGLTCKGSTSQGHTCSGFLASVVDGTLLDLRVAVPPGKGPGARSTLRMSTSRWKTCAA